MKKQKFIAILVITSLIASVFFNFILVGSVNADETPTITTSVYSSDKSLKVDIKNINLDETHQYKFGVSSSKGAQPTNWYDLVEIDGNSAWFVITPQRMKNVLIASDNAYVFIKDTDTDVEVLSGEKISLKMPLDEALNFTIYESSFQVDSLYGNDAGKYQIVKIEDKNIIKEYLDAKDNNQNTLVAVRNLLTKEIPIGNWKDYHYILKHDLETKYEGLYYLWFQKEFTTGRIVTGYTLYDTYPTGYKLAESESSQSTSTNSEDQNKTSNTESQSENSQTQPQSQDSQAQGSTQTEDEQSIIEAIQGQESNTQEQKNTFNGHTYEIIEKVMDWKEAKKYCESQGGYLVTVNSAEEQKFIENLIEAKKYGDKKIRFWIGATDEETEGNWKWVTGEKFDYKNWGEDEPDDSPNQDYAVIYNYESRIYGIKKYQWDDINLSQTSEETVYFILEKGTDNSNNSNSEKSDTTVATTKIPQTGQGIAIVIVTMVTVGIAVFAYNATKKYKGIK